MISVPRKSLQDLQARKGVSWCLPTPKQAGEHEIALLGARGGENEAREHVDGCSGACGRLWSVNG